ncbi:hypothetical protein AHF37_04575 [Paragonimus kellicotti]|nr:hypothetical protein AHF37_04575 [Paragonimus kellicotti]
MEIGPTVILATSVTASSSSSSLNSSISIMTMGAGNSTLTPPSTGPKRLTKPVFGACDMLDLKPKSLWPDSKLDSTRYTTSGLGDSRHSASDTQLENNCASLARQQSPVTLSDFVTCYLHMEIGPTVILATSVTASSSSSSLNSSISIMTMGAGNSTLTPPSTGPKRLTKPVFGACDMLDLKPKSLWPDSKLDSTRYTTSGLGDSRHSASDTQLENNCASLARQQSPVTLSDDLHTANETPSCQSSPSPTNTLIHVTLSIPCDLPVNTLDVRTQDWEQPNSCPNSHTRLNHEPQLRQQPRQNSEQSTHLPMAHSAAVVLQFADRQPLIAQLNPLVVGNVSDPLMDTTCPGSQLKRPNKVEPNEKTCTTHGTVARQYEGSDRPNRCSSFNFFKLKRTNSGHNSNRRQSESTVGLLQQNSKHRKPLDSGGKSVYFTWNSEDPAMLIDTNYDNFRLDSFQHHNMVRHSTTDGPRSRTNESPPIFPSGEQSNSKHPFTTISPTKHPPVSVCDDSMDHVVEALTGENKDSLNEEATENLLNRPNLTATSSIVSLTTDPRSRTCCFCWCCCCSCSCMRVRANVHGSKRPSASNDPQSKLDELSVDENMRVRANVHGSKRPSASNDPQSKLDELSVDEK